MHRARRPQTDLPPDPELRARVAPPEIGERALAELIETAVPQIAGTRDHFAYIQFHRTVLVLLREEGRTVRLPDGAAPPHTEVARAARTIETVLGGQGGRMAAPEKRPPLIRGSTFPECLAQYDELIAYVGGIWASACALFRGGTDPLAAFVAILAIEEIGRLDRLWYDLLAWDYATDQVETRDPREAEHRRKDFLAAVRRAVTSPRLRRLFGPEPIERLVADIESGEIERFRKRCLYIDTAGGWLTTPVHAVERQTAEFLVVLAGELWAEVLGHFPWKYYEMINKVAEFELAIGLPHERVWDPSLPNAE